MCLTNMETIVPIRNNWNSIYEFSTSKKYINKNLVRTFLNTVKVEIMIEAEEEERNCIV